MSALITVNRWGHCDDQVIYSIKISNSSGAYVEIITYGATIVSLCVPNKVKKLDNIILGYNHLEDYLHDQFYLGSTIGRYANRINGAKFCIGETSYQLDKNDGEHSNHGGYFGYHRRLFDFELIEGGVVMTLKDQHGTGGYPGTILLKITYIWSDSNELSIVYDAVCDQLTIANFTNHCYFNLSGNESGVIDNILWMDAEHYLESDKDHVPTGVILKDPHGFSEGKALNKVIDSSQPVHTGLNHYFILAKNNGELTPDAILSDPASGRQLQVYTSYPGIMVYTGQYLNIVSGREGYPYLALSGLCIECQHYPDSIHHDNFPTAFLKPGEPYNEFIRFRFHVT